MAPEIVPWTDARRYYSPKGRLHRWRTLNAALWVVTASVTEVSPDGTPHSGAAFYRTWSVQLDQHGNFIQIAFDLNWSWPLSSAAMIWLGVT